MIVSSVVFLHKHGPIDKTPIDFDGYKTHSWTLRRKHYYALKVRVWRSQHLQIWQSRWFT